MIKILYVDHDGNGFARSLELPVGTTIATFFAQQKPDARASEFQIRVRRGSESFGGPDQQLTPDFALLDNDRVAFTPSKIEAAA